MKTNGARPGEVEGQVNHSTEFYKSLFENLGTAVAVFQKGGRLSQVNHAFAQWTGLSKHSLESKRNLLDFIDSAEHQKVTRSMVDYFELREPESRSLRCSFINDKGERRQIEIFWSWVGDLNDRLATLQDVSGYKPQNINLFETKEYENLLHLLSHNLKSPIVSIKGFATLLKEDGSDAGDEKQTHYVDRIYKNASRMEKMIHDIFNYSKFKKRERFMKRLSLQEMVTAVCADFQFEVHNRNITLKLAEDFPTIQADCEDMQTVFNNLLDNAIKYMGDVENPEIEIGWEDKNRFYVFWVKDNGVGVSEDYQDKIFDWFQRGNTSNRIDGTGVGLSIVQQIMEKYDGKVRLSSKIGRGTTVYIALPKVVDDDLEDQDALRHG
ncbi:MAG: ATP-binding protein [bacterium]